MWVKIDDRFPNHPKVIRAGGDAVWLYLCGLCFCAEHLTDGVIPASVISRLSDRKRSKKLAAKLVEVGLWEETADGFFVHDFHDWNPSAEEVRAKRAEVSETKRKAGKIGAAKRWGSGPTDGTGDGKRDGTAIAGCHPSADGEAIANGWQSAWQKDGPVPVPVPVPKPECESAHTQKRASDPEYVAIRDRIRHWPIFASLNAERLADEQGGWMMSKGQKLAWVLQAIDDAATQCVDGATHEAKHEKLVRYMHNARRPRRDLDAEPVKVIESRDDPEILAAAIRDGEARRKKYERRGEAEPAPTVEIAAPFTLGDLRGGFERK